MVYNIIYLNKTEKDFLPDILRYPGTNLFVPSDFDTVEKVSVNEKIRSVFEKNHLQPSDAGSEILNLALSVYTADQLISRAADGYFNWSRHFRLFLPVVNLVQWTSVSAYVEEMLSFLTGDHWEIHFRETTAQQKVGLSEETPKVDKVCLFSGGLDSFIGAIDLLEKKSPTVLISHHKVGGTETTSQTALEKMLKSHYGDNLVNHLSFYVQPNQKHELSKSENTSRGRSVLFISLAVAVANSFGPDVEVVIPENGLISLNVPLTRTRIGSSSTRTTHPYFLNLFAIVLKGIGITNTLSNPYQIKTKGEMILECSNKEILVKHIPESMSCAHPSVARYSGHNPNTHCGYCVPCIIRRASLHKAGIDSIETYSVDVLKTPPDPKGDIGRDYRAYQMAINRIKKEKPNLSLHILASGPLTFDNALPLQDYKNVYERGLNEVDAFLNQ